MYIVSCICLGIILSFCWFPHEWAKQNFNVRSLCMFFSILRIRLLIVFKIKPCYYLHSLQTGWVFWTSIQLSSFEFPPLALWLWRIIKHNTQVRRELFLLPFPPHCFFSPQLRFISFGKKSSIILLSYLNTPWFPLAMYSSHCIEIVYLLVALSLWNPWEHRLYFV